MDSSSSRAGIRTSTRGAGGASGAPATETAVALTIGAAAPDVPTSAAPTGTEPRSRLSLVASGRAPGERRLRRREPRDRHAVGRAGHVVEPGAVAEVHARGVAAVLP